jgi:hypothetical protein
MIRKTKLRTSSSQVDQEYSASVALASLRTNEIYATPSGAGDGITSQIRGSLQLGCGVHDVVLY